MHDARVPQVGGKLFHTLAFRVTSQSGSWKMFYMLIMHHQVLMTNLLCPTSPSFLICVLFLDWKSQLGHWFADDMGSPLCEWWNTLSKEFWMLCYKSGHHHHWLLLEGIQSVNNVTFQKSYHHLVIISSTWNYFYSFRYVVNNNQYVLMAKRRKKWYHEVDIPYIKNLNH